MFSKITKYGLALAFSAATIGTVANNANAAIVQYSDQGSFDAVATVVNQINFEGYAGPQQYTSYQNSLTISGVTFSDLTNRLFVFASSYYGAGGPQTSGDYINANDYQDSLNVLLPNGINAVSFNAGSIFGQAGVGSVVFSTGETFTYNYGSNALTFVGFTSDTPLTSFSISSGITALDNFALGTTSVPEPTTVALLGLGLLGFAASRRKLAKK